MPKPKSQPEASLVMRSVEAVAVGTRRPDVVAGLDTASNRLHMVSSNGLVLAHVCTAKMQDDDRRHQLYDAAENFFGLLPGGTLLMVEEPLALQNGKTTRLLGLAGGAIWAAHLKFPVFWAWVNVSTWKREVVGKGNATKDEVAEWVQENLGQTYGAEDHYDAACICHYGGLALDKLYGKKMEA